MARACRGRLFELIIFLVLAWHYIGCFWWYVGDMCQRSAEERLRVLDANLFTSPETSQHDASSLTMQYLASVYWAVMMSTGLNVAIGPGMRAGQIAYECVITFFGVCLQAYMLGTAASEIANMDAQDTARRQKLKTIKQHLRALRVPLFLRVPIMEYYERETTMSESRESDVIKDMPPSLKVQLAVTLNADFLRSVSFFANLDGVISAALVMCMRSRVCLPAEIVIMQGDVTRVLYFVRSGSCQVRGAPTPEDAPPLPFHTRGRTSPSLPASLPPAHPLPPPACRTSPRRTPPRHPLRCRSSSRRALSDYRPRRTTRRTLSGHSSTHCASTHASASSRS